jgi:hypothetical protein
MNFSSPISMSTRHLCFEKPTNVDLYPFLFSDYCIFSNLFEVVTHKVDSIGEGKEVKEGEVLVKRKGTKVLS